MDFAEVIIVGGGVAGLSAAKTLGKDVNYLLIEAQNYLGGRICNVDAGQNLILDLGAQYIHGDKKNSVYDLCEQLGILLSDDEDEDDDDALVLTSDRKSLNSDLLEKATKLWEKILEKAEDLNYDRGTGTTMSFADYVPKEFEKRLLSSSSFSRDIIEPLVNYFIKLEMTETSCLSISDLNLKEYCNYEDLKGEYENDLKNGGYRPFIEHFKSQIPSDNRVRLNTEVIRVKYSEDEEKLFVEMIDLINNQQTTIKCNYVIWTTSLGYLKEHFHQIFADQPDLIKQKQNSIENIGFGTVNKVFLIYQKRFWERNISSIVLLHLNQRERFEMSENLRKQIEEENVHFDVVHQIVEMLFHFDVLPSSDVPVLICWFVGPCAILMENLSEKLIGQICHEVLCCYLQINHEKYSLIEILRSRWNSNRFIRGSYSYYSVRSHRQDGKQLRKSYSPDGTPRIVFAGEATHEGYYSTVNAALETGIRAAKEILSSMDE